MTDIDNLIAKLRIVNDKFLSITHKNLLNLEYNFDELFKLMKKELRSDKLLGCFVPIFFNLDNWQEWHLRLFTYSKYITKLTSLNKPFTIQSKIDEKMLPFTESIINYQKNKTKTKDRGRINIRITLSETHSFLSSPDIITYKIKRGFHEKNLTNVYKINISEKNKLDKSELREIPLPKNILKNISNTPSKIKKLLKTLKISYKPKFLKKIHAAAISHSLYINNDYDLLFIFSSTVKDTDNNRNLGLGGSFILIRKEIFEKEDKAITILRLFEQITDKLAVRITNHFQLEAINKEQLKTAVISILIDSFAHNIAAHSLQQILKWLNTRIQYSNQKFRDQALSKCINLNKSTKKDKEKEVNEVNEFSQFLENDEINISSVLWSGKIDCMNQLITSIKEIRNQNNELEIVNNTPLYLPLSFDVFRYNFLKYINNKSTFWSGAIKDSVLGGTITNWFDILYEFCYNPYFIGTIAGSENIFKVHFRVHYKKNVLEKVKKTDDDTNFMTINLKNMMNQESSEDGDKIIEDGGDFDELKEKLKDKLVFLPGGDVGRHSLYTIFENCLRNVKHCERKINGEKEIEFNIRINETNGKYYNVDIWLSNKSDLYKTDKIIIEKENNKFSSEVLQGKDIYKIFHKNDEENQNKEINSYTYIKSNGTITNINSYDEISVEYKVKKTLSFMTEDIQKSIIDENSKPRMGGTYQDKICACQLFTNDFINVDKEYKLGTSNLNFIEYNEKNANKKTNQCCLVSSFHVWKGDNYNKRGVSFKGEPDAGGLLLKDKTIIENIRRFKLFVASKEKDKSKIESFGVVRVIVDEKDNNEKFERYYDKWLDEWIGKENKKYLKIQSTSSTKALGQKQDNKWKIIKSNRTSGNIDCVDFAHSNRCNQLICRSHGNISNFFDINRHLKFNSKKMTELRAKEFIETVLTSIYIVDNRVNNLMKSYIKKTSANNILWEQMKIKSLSEGKDRYYRLKKLKELKSDLNSIGRLHFLILHLSYIKDLYGDRIKQFIEENLKNSNNEFIFKKLIITTGRGRGKWFRKIQEKGGNELVPKVMFIPPESLTSAISYGIRIKDDFEIKYRLIKLLMN